MRTALHLARTLNRSLGEVLSWSVAEVQLWIAFLTPEDPAADTSALDAICD